MFNFMSCNAMIFDNRNSICVTYKAQQPHFSIYLRKYDHGFHEIIDSTSREGCCGQKLEGKELFIISDDNYLQAYDEKTFQQMGDRLVIPMSSSSTDDPIEILNFKVSHNEKYIAVLCGKNLIKEIEELHELFIYEVNDIGDKYTLIKEIKLPEEFRYFSVAFEFDKSDKESESTLVMIDTDKIMKYNYMLEKLEVLFKFKNSLDSQPDFFEFNEEQTVAILASSNDALWIDIKNQSELDVDENFEIGDIKALLYDNGKFYLLANKFRRKLGYFLL